MNLEARRLACLTHKLGGSSHRKNTGKQPIFQSRISRQPTWIAPHDNTKVTTKEYCHLLRPYRYAGSALFHQQFRRLWSEPIQIYPSKNKQWSWRSDFWRINARKLWVHTHNTHISTGVLWKNVWRCFGSEANQWAYVGPTWIGASVSPSSLSSGSILRIPRSLPFCSWTHGYTNHPG